MIENWMKTLFAARVLFPSSYLTDQWWVGGLSQFLRHRSSCADGTDEFRFRHEIMQREIKRRLQYDFIAPCKLSVPVNSPLIEKASTRLPILKSPLPEIHLVSL